MYEKDETQRTTSKLQTDLIAVCLTVRQRGLLRTQADTRKHVHIAPLQVARFRIDLHTCLRHGQHTPFSADITWFLP